MDISEVNFKLIWGIQENGLPSVSMYDLNDIDILQNKYTGEYLLEFEEIYIFENELSRINYYKRLVDKFKGWLLDSGYDINEVDISMSSKCFDQQYSTYLIESIMPLKDPDLVQLYYKAKLFVACLEAIYNAVKMEED